jgi:hypothetical protein
MRSGAMLAVDTNGLVRLMTRDDPRQVAVVDGQDEAEVDRVPQTAAVLSEGLADRRLVL